MLDNNGHIAYSPSQRREMRDALSDMKYEAQELMKKIAEAERLLNVSASLDEVGRAIDAVQYKVEDIEDSSEYMDDITASAKSDWRYLGEWHDTI